MIAHLRFELPEEDLEFKAASHALELIAVISDLDNDLRNSIKHGIDRDKARVCESLRKDLWENINGRGVAHLFE